MNNKVYKNMQIMTLNGFGHLAICNNILQDFHEVQKRDALLYKVPSKSTVKNFVTNVYCFYLKKLYQNTS